MSILLNKMPEAPLKKCVLEMSINASDSGIESPKMDKCPSLYYLVQRVFFINSSIQLHLAVHCLSINKPFTYLYQFMERLEHLGHQFCVIYQVPT